MKGRSAVGRGERICVVLDLKIFLGPPVCNTTSVWQGEDMEKKKWGMEALSFHVLP